MTTLTTYALRLPKSVKAEAEALSKADGTSLNQFVAIAVAERIAVLKTAAFFDERRQRATGTALEALLSRNGGEPPREGDELPEGWVPLAPRAAATGKAAKPVKPANRAAAASRTPKKKA
ncbi:hypothetical protein [Roseateles sp. LYH14W]|uniref:Toxin-antitoxin system HicB family antitoxin n=1 Tax=Pelomonas parva TaxID=3299032 RepID=A0ABW7F236_9BURK